MIVNSYKCCGGKEGCGTEVSGGRNIIDPDKWYSYAAFRVTRQDEGDPIVNAFYHVCPSKGYP
jgi:hypothetical protein